jgi:hypothetical protein
MASRNTKKPPWGDILGGKPIEPFERQGDFVMSVDTAEEMKCRMERLKDHYGAQDWYDLAVILAKQRDVALTVTSLGGWLAQLRKPQWNGRHGIELVALVDLLRSQGYTTWQAIADELRDEHPCEFYQHMTADTLKARYMDARRYMQRRTSRER